MPKARRILPLFLSVLVASEVAAQVESAVAVSGKAAPAAQSSQPAAPSSQPAAQSSQPAAQSSQPVAPSSPPAASSSSPSSPSAPSSPSVEAASQSSSHDQELDEDARAQFAKDLALVIGINMPGWKASSPEGLVTSFHGLVPPEGLPASSAAGMPTSMLEEMKCTSLISRNWSRGERVCRLELVRCASDLGAYSAYTNLRRGATTIVTRGNATSEDDNAISIWKGNAFLLLTANAEDDTEAKALLTAVADRIVAKLGESSAGVPPIMKLLPGVDRVQGSERLFVGPESIRRFTHVPYSHTLILEQCRGAAYAEYQFSPPVSERLRLLVVDYGDLARSKAAFEGFSQCFAGERVVEETESRFLVKSNSTYIHAQLMGPRLAIITGARKKFAPSYLARQLR